MQHNKRLLKNYIYNSVYQLIILLIPLLLTPFLTRVIGADGIGKYSYTRSVVTYFILFGTVGSNLYAQREIAIVEDNIRKRSILFWEILTFRIVMLCISLFFYLVTEVRYSEYAILFSIQSIDIIAAMADIAWYFQGREQFDKIVVRNVIVKIMTALLLVLLIHSPQDLNIYVCIYAIGNLLGQLLMWKDIPNEVVRCKVSLTGIFRHTRNMLILFLPQVAIQLYLVIDKTMIELLTHDSSQIGYYELAQTIERTGVTLVTAFGTVTASRVAILKGKNDLNGIKHLITQSYEIIFFTACPVFLGIIAIASNLIPWFLGASYTAVTELLYILSPLILIIGLSNISGIQYMVPMGLQTQMTISTVIGAGINIVLNYLLIPLYSAKGAAIASCISEMAVMLVQLIWIYPILSYIRILKSMSSALISSIVMLFAVKYTEKTLLHGVSSIVNTLILVAEGVVIYFFMQYLFGNSLFYKLSGGRHESQNRD